MKNNNKSEFTNREYTITGATIKDGKCDYSYRVTDGKGAKRVKLHFSSSKLIR